MSSADYGVETYSPEDPECFDVWITASIGPVGEEGAELFQFRVTTPAYLARTVVGDEAQWMRHTLLVVRYDPQIVREALERYLDPLEGDDWNEVAQKVARIAFWEFEDYRPVEG